MSKESSEAILFPTLYHKAKTGKIHSWRVWACQGMHYTEHGTLDGKKQISFVVSLPKNTGKANATTAAEQAIIEAKSLWTFKVTRKYSETIENAKEEVFLPMTAHDFKVKKGKGIKYPANAQPKLDGTRVLAYWENDEIYLGSRSGQEWTVPSHIKDELEKYMPKEMVLDGELYIYGIDFDFISSRSKKWYPETFDLEYHVFDMPIDEHGNANLPWRERLAKLTQFLENTKDLRVKVVPVETITVNSEKELLEYEDYCVEREYEGGMVRNLDGRYIFGIKSSEIQKLKSFVDSEFLIVGFKHGKGKDSECVIWICQTPEGLLFDVRPKATTKQKQIWFKEGDQHIGEWLKIRYQNLTEKDKKPRFPRSVGFRDIKDMS